MDAAHVHLLLNHVPVLGTIFGLVLFAVGFARKQTILVQASLVVFVVSGLFAGAAYLTGEGAEEVVERLGGVSEAYLGPHENAAFYALIASGVLGLFALAGLFVHKEALPRPLAVTVLLLALATSGVMAWTANLGGQIRHPEIRSGSVADQMEVVGGQPDQDREDDEDED